MRIHSAAGIVAVAIAAAMWSGAAARAANKSDDMDCADTDFKLDVLGYTVTCQKESNDTMEVDGYMAARKAYDLFAYSDSEQAFIEVLDNRTIGDRVYLRRRSLEADVRGYFGKLTTSNWSAAQGNTGFDTSEFDGGPPNHTHMECIGFRRPVEVHDAGYGRIVVGVACSAIDRKKAYELLSHLTAPGA